MKKIAIYTAVTGQYDQLEDPKVIDSRCDYICFTNNPPALANSVWQFRQIPNVSTNQVLLSRYPKMHPHLLLSDYDYSVYMDANIQIIGKDFYTRIFDKIEKGVILSGIKHPFRDCPYDEGYVVFTYNLDKISNILRTLLFLKKQGFPQHYGMFEANVILRNNQSEKIKKQCEEWWDLINRFSRRDQLTYPYTLWKNSIPFDYIIPEGQSARNYKAFAFTSHLRKKNIWGKKLKRIGKLIYNLIVNLFHRFRNQLPA